MWSSLRRCGMEMRQQAGRSLVLREAEALRDRARDLNAGAATLQLDASVQVPRYQSAIDNHCMPGSYFAELFPDDVSAAANYDAGMFATTTGLFGRFLDGAGGGTAWWLRQRRPGWQPRRILDLGCGVGHNSVPVARAYPQSEVVAVDLSAPMLRYGHARARGMGVSNLTFRQASAEAVPYPDRSFDFIYTTMFLHETSYSALRNILREVDRLLAPGGLHMPSLIRQVGFAADTVFETEIHAVVEDEMPKVAVEVEDYGRGGKWYAVGSERPAAGTAPAP
jgi:SAM-dependent methyltransferase